MERNKITDWKDLAIQERHLHQQADKNREQLATALHKTKHLLNRTSNYNKFLEQKIDDLEDAYKSQEDKLHTTIQMLKKAKQLFQQKKIEIEMLAKHNLITPSQTTEVLIAYPETESLDTYFVYKSLDTAD